jgi:sarcosine oxidase subunit alpha
VRRGQPFRLPAGGGAIDRDRPLGFSFDGRRYEGFAGDTLAAALLANGVRLVGRSFKYHRPRGIYAAGPEEPNALLEVDGVPNTRATMVELHEGLSARSQHRWPSRNFDLGAVADALAPLIPAGFYYKTFMGAPGWMFWERWIRRAAGLGVAPARPDQRRYEHRHAHCDVLVVGAGPCGIEAAREAARTGARTILLDERARDVALADATVLTRTTAFGYYDQNMVCAVERVADGEALWWIRAREVVLATGAIERPLVFADNDLPGVVLASAARRYVEDHAVAPGRRVVVFTNNDSAYAAALALDQPGIAIAAIVDARAAPGPAAERARAAGLRLLPGHLVTAAHGRGRLRGVDVARADAPQTAIEFIACDCLAVSGGWTPTLHLHSQAGGRTLWDERIGAFVPGRARQHHRSAGAARGVFGHNACRHDGAEAGAAAARDAGYGEGTSTLAAPPDEAEANMLPLWAVPAPKKRGKRFVDLQDDVTVADLTLAVREGYRSVEHLKRYTTLGMGTDQGKTSNVNGLALLAATRGEPIPEVGHTTFRPPYTPVTLGAIVGRDTGQHFEPVRRSAIHDRHAELGARFVTAGLWLRPLLYAHAGETSAETIAREVRTVRGACGIVDVSTLGKIDVQGPDAARFLDRLYCNEVGGLAVGRARYGLMLREDGMVLDDGTLSRLATERFYVTTTTANAAKVMQHIELYLQVAWPELRVAATPVSEQYAVVALAGPRARTVLERAAPGIDVSDAALPHMGVVEGRVAGLPARVFRLSFSGERAYEVAVPADQGTYLWDALLEAGRPLGLAPYGTEAMGVLRIEKGHVAGAELDGRTTAEDLGLGRLVSARKDFIGRAALDRPGLRDRGRKRLVGLVPLDRAQRLRAGAQLVADAGAKPPVAMLGVVTSAALSPMLGHSVALALLEGGLARKGERLVAAFPLAGESVPVEVVAPVFVDPEGRRVRD